MQNRILIMLLLSALPAHASNLSQANGVVSTSTPAPPKNDRVMKYYELGKPNGPALYVHKTNTQKDSSGINTTKTTVTDMSGNVVYSEVLTSKGSMPILQKADVYQTKRHLELEVKEDRVYFRTRALGPEKTEEPQEENEKLPDHFISGALAETFALEHFDELLAGDTIHAKMGIMEVREMISFKFFKKEMIKMNSREVMVVAMKPSSIFISFLVDTIFLYFDVKDKKMLRHVGRTPLWKNVDGKLKPLDAEVVLE